MTGEELEKLHTMTHYQDVAGRAVEDRRQREGTIVDRHTRDGADGSPSGRARARDLEDFRLWLGAMRVRLTDHYLVVKQ